MMVDESKYSIRAYCGDTDGGYDEEGFADNLKEARAKAKAMMSDEHMRYVESTAPVKYVEIVETKSGDVVQDFGTRD